jgi:hypothetical protein
MDQIGVHMNFLQIKQVLTFIYALKSIYVIISYFPKSLNRPSNTEKCRGWRVRIPKTQCTTPLDRGFYFQ